MFQLIVAVIAIALVVAMVAMSMWFGGDAFTNGSEKATFARYQNEGTQIAGALRVYEAMTGTSPSKFYDMGDNVRIGDWNFEDLTDYELLKDTTLRNRNEDPWVIENGQVRRLIDMTGISDDRGEQLKRCVRFNTYALKNSSPVRAKYGNGTASAPGGCPPCADKEFADYPACEDQG